MTTNKGLYYAAAAEIDKSQLTTKPPTVVIASPASTSGSAVYFSGAQVEASFACLDPDSVVTSCTGSVTGPGLQSPTPVGLHDLLPTTTPGTYTFTVTATLADGSTAVGTVTYTVVELLLAGATGNGTGSRGLSLSDCRRRDEHDGIEPHCRRCAAGIRIRRRGRIDPHRLALHRGIVDSEDRGVRY